MKRMMTLLLSAALLFSLTACGRKNDHVAENNMAGSNGATDKNDHYGSVDDGTAADNDASMGSNYETPHIDGAETPAEQSGKSTLRKDATAVMDSAKRAGEDVKETLQGEDWNAMLRNARVRDRDGKLKDGENALLGRYATKS